MGLKAKWIGRRLARDRLGLGDTGRPGGGGGQRKGFVSPGGGVDVGAVELSTESPIDTVLLPRWALAMVIQPNRIMTPNTPMRSKRTLMVTPLVEGYFPGEKVPDGHTIGRRDTKNRPRGEGQFLSSGP